MTQSSPAHTQRRLNNTHPPQLLPGPSMEPPAHPRILSISQKELRVMKMEKSRKYKFRRRESPSRPPPNTFCTSRHSPSGERDEATSVVCTQASCVLCSAYLAGTDVLCMHRTDVQPLPSWAAGSAYPPHEKQSTFALQKHLPSSLFNPTKKITPALTVLHLSGLQISH